MRTLLIRRTVLADILLKVLPATQQDKQAFSYYKDRRIAQANRNYSEALENIMKR